MVQIGDLHIGKAQSAITPSLSVLEAGLLWDALVGRYKCIEETQIYLKYAHDPDFKALLKFGVGFLRSQADELEQQMIKYQMAMPPRPPLAANDPETSHMVLTDQFMFWQIFEGCQAFVDYFARVTRSMVTSDSLRKVMSGLLTDDLMLFDKLCKFAKTKGWIQQPPLYKPSN